MLSNVSGFAICFFGFYEFWSACVISFKADQISRKIERPTSPVGGPEEGSKHAPVTPLRDPFFNHSSGLFPILQNALNFFGVIEYQTTDPGIGDFAITSQGVKGPRGYFEHSADLAGF
jgi:hypothetical protein